MRLYVHFLTGHLLIKIIVFGFGFDFLLFCFDLCLRVVLPRCAWGHVGSVPSIKSTFFLTPSGSTHPHLSTGPIWYSNPLLAYTLYYDKYDFYFRMVSILLLFNTSS